MYLAMDYGQVPATLHCFLTANEDMAKILKTSATTQPARCPVEQRVTPVTRPTYIIRSVGSDRSTPSVSHKNLLFSIFFFFFSPINLFNHVNWESTEKPF